MKKVYALIRLSDYGSSGVDQLIAVSGNLDSLALRAARYHDQNPATVKIEKHSAYQGNEYYLIRGLPDDSELDIREVEFIGEESEEPLFERQSD